MDEILDYIFSGKHKNYEWSFINGAMMACKEDFIGKKASKIFLEAGMKKMES